MEWSMSKLFKNISFGETTLDYTVYIKKKMYFAPIVFVFDLFAWIDEKGFDIVILMYHIKYATWLNAFPLTDYNCLKPFPK